MRGSAEKSARNFSNASRASLCSPRSISRAANVNSRSAAVSSAMAGFAASNANSAEKTKRRIVFFKSIFLVFLCVLCALCGGSFPGFGRPELRGKVGVANTRGAGRVKHPQHVLIPRSAVATHDHTLVGVILDQPPQQRLEIIRWQHAV